MSDTIQITPAWLTETERLAGEATAGPWEVVKRGNTIQFYSIPGVCSGISPLTGNAAHIARVDPAAVTAWARETRRAWAERDAAKVLELQADDERRQVERELKQTTSALNLRRAYSEQVEQERDAARAEVARLRTLLARARSYVDNDDTRRDPAGWGKPNPLLAEIDAALRADAPARPEGETNGTQRA